MAENRVTLVATLAGTVGGLLTVSALVFGGVSEFWRAYDRCAYSPPPSGAAVVEPGVVDSFAVLFPIGYGCTWETETAVVSAIFPNWFLTGMLITGVSLILAAGIAFAVPVAGRRGCCTDL